MKHSRNLLDCTIQGSLVKHFYSSEKVLVQDHDYFKIVQRSTIETRNNQVLVVIIVLLVVVYFCQP